MQETDFIFRKLSPICTRVHLTVQRPWDRFSDTLRGSSHREAEAQGVNGGLFCTAHPLPVCSPELHHLGDALSHEDCTRLDQVFSDHYKFSGVSTYHFSAYYRCRTERQGEWKTAWKCRGCIFAMLDGDHLAMLDGKYILCILGAFWSP